MERQQASYVKKTKGSHLAAKSGCFPRKKKIEEKKKMHAINSNNIYVCVPSIKILSYKRIMNYSALILHGRG